MSKPVRQPSSLYRRLLSSHLQIAGIAALLLCACSLLVTYFQRGSSTIADVRLPSSVASANAMFGIESSTSLLRSWVLLGRSDSRMERHQVWSEQIEPAIRELEMLAGQGDRETITELKQQMTLLKESQWWVEDMAATVGNNAARLIYERELLPIYDHIQRAVIGLSSENMHSSNVSEIQLATAMTHQNLSEAVRRLSEAVRTGGIAEIKDFKSGSRTVKALLAQLADQISGDSLEAADLLSWITREYRVYEQLANHIIGIRQSDDWNRALFALRTHTQPLADQVNHTLMDLQNDHNALLQKDISRASLVSTAGTVVTWTMIFVLGGIALLMARNKSNRLVAPIEALAEASEQLANKGGRPVQLPVAGPREIAHLTERFNYMSRELTARSNDLEHANRELQEYTHIITHDLKPPLINIKGHAGLIKNQLQDLEGVALDKQASEQDVRDKVLQSVTQDVPESVYYIDQSIAKTNTLIGGVMDNSRLLFREISMDHTDMNQLVRQVAGLFSHRLNKVDFQCAELPTIRTDAFLMEHIFSNLIDNALKYLDPNRPGRIEISSERDDHEVHFFVRDNGMGLGSSAIDIFKLFKQADQSTGGAGVGLALVKTMLSKLGGRIEHHQNPDFGLTFVFSVPHVNDDS